MPRLEGDRFLLLGAADLDELKDYVARRDPHIDLSVHGSRSAFRVELQQNTPKLGGNRVTARPGDTLGFQGAKLVTEAAALRPAAPKPPVEQVGLFDVETGAGV